MYIPHPSLYLLCTTVVLSLPLLCIFLSLSSSLSLWTSLFSTLLRTALNPTFLLSESLLQLPKLWWYHLFRLVPRTILVKPSGEEGVCAHSAPFLLLQCVPFPTAGHFKRRLCTFYSSLYKYHVPCYHIISRPHPCPENMTKYGHYQGWLIIPVMAVPGQSSSVLVITS